MGTDYLPYLIISYTQVDLVMTSARWLADEKDTELSYIATVADANAVPQTYFN